MKTILAIAVIIGGGLFAIEKTTGRDLGIGHMASTFKGSVAGAFAGGYGTSLGVAGSAGSGLANSVGGAMRSIGQ